MKDDDYSKAQRHKGIAEAELTKRLKALNKDRGILTLDGIKPKSKQSWYSVSNKSATAAELVIYDEIGMWGVSAKDMIDDLKEMGDVSNLHVRINSPGGSVIDGNAIYNVIKNHSARVTVEIEGVALSMGSVIAMAGDYISMAENGLMMIHNPWGGAMGDADEMRKTADVMDKMKKTLIGSYVKKTGIDAAEISDLMDAETWMDAEEALELGFIDEISGEMEMAASFDLTKFGNVPAQLLPSGQSDNTTRGDVMVDKTKQAPTDDTSTVDTDGLKAAARAEALAAEGKRRGEITEIFSLHGEAHRDLKDTCLGDIDVSPADASAKLLEAIGKNNAPLSGNARINVGEDAHDKFREGAALGLMIRAGKENSKDHAGNEFRGDTMLDIAKKSLAMSGVNMAGMSRMGIVGAAFTHSTSDFPYLLENIASKTLLNEYDIAAETWQQIATIGSVSDFKVNSRIRLGSFNSLDTIGELEEYTAGTFGEEKETIQAATKGKLISLSRQMIINDDLNGLMRIAAMMGRAGARTIGTDVYNILINNAALGDGIALFHASHNNLAASGAAPTVATVGAARSAMRMHQDLNSNDYLNIRPEIILGPVGLQDTLDVLMASETDPTASQNNSKKPNAVRNAATVITDPRLDGDSTTRWYLLASPSVEPIVEIAFLDGNQTPYLESEQGFTVDGIRWKVRLDYGTAGVGFRGGYMNDGV